MRVPFYDIKAQYDDLAASMTEAVQSVLSSGAYVLGPNHNSLEREIAGRHGVKHGIGVANGTDALRILMDALEIGEGDEVITPAFTFVASVETVVQTGATPVFVDMETESFGLDPARIEAAITHRTKAILPVHLFGQLCRIEEIKEIADRHGLLLLEDGAQALDSHHRGQFAGQFGLGCGFSFYVTKNLGAAGDAGMIITNRDDVNERCRSMRIHGMGRERYYYDYLGYTSRLDEIQAAVLRIKLQKLEAWNQRRQQLADIYFRDLADLPITLPTVLDGNNHTWHQFSILTERRDELQAFLKSREVDSMIYYPVPIHYHAPYVKYGGGKGSLPVTESACQQILNLPIQPHLSDDHIHHVVASIREFAAS
jgi:dTDP-4-amino-4,6-dideoxygalactose transaminase